MLFVCKTISLKEYGSRFPPKLRRFPSPNVPAMSTKRKASGRGTTSKSQGTSGPKRPLLSCSQQGPRGSFFWGEKGNPQTAAAAGER